MSSRDFQKGKEAEELFLNKFRKAGIPINDVRDVKEYQAKDIDFVIKKNNCVFSVDVKYAGKDCGHDLLELEVDGNAGWAYGSEANYVIIYKKPLNEWHVLKMDEVKKFLAEKSNLINNRTVNVETKRNDDSVKYYTKNLMVSYETLEKNNILHRIRGN